MTYVITQSCCSDASCVPTCPVDCIHPTPDEPGYMNAELLYIDPDTCIDCSACVQACPVDAIVSDDELAPDMQSFLRLNEDYYQRRPRLTVSAVRGGSPHVWPGLAGARIAVVGSGAAGSYAAAMLLESGAQVDVYERLLTPLGLIRFGVAPDHASTKAVSSVFPYQGQKPGLTLHLGVEVGKHISHAELLQHHHAVLYAVGASSDRRLDIAGENLPGSHSATDFVAWYNGHPDASGLTFDLSSERAVVVGNGNVALDVARILVTDPDMLAHTDIADHALEALRKSAVREVVVLGRRGPVQAAYSTPELMGLLSNPGFDVVALPDEVALDVHSRASLDRADTEADLRRKAELAEQLAAMHPAPGRRRIVLRYLLSPIELRGTDRVEEVRVVHNRIVVGDGESLTAEPTDRVTSLRAGLVLRSVGYRGEPIADLPFDAASATIPNEFGRVMGMAGTYVAGWIKRGPSGMIGTNKQCAADTITRLAEDFSAGRLSAPTGDAQALAALLAGRCGYQAGLAGWNRIDAAERAAGAATGRPRVKIVDPAELLALAEESAILAVSKG
ncbi:Ferredoxin--NADP(+) reductase [Mycolicibacterium rhodesiae JS60]|nr:Ferredoxin--NADP(+) reductase [Mycolicibacterium rhodesiae JS60]